MSKPVLIKSDALPKEFLEVHPHNLYLYCKSYAASMRSNTAKAKTRAEVSGGGKKPFAQKGGGRARQGSITAPHYRGGGVAFGPTNNRNYNQKVNKKQKKLALYHAIAEKTANDRFFVTDSIVVESGKTKDAISLISALGQRDVLFVKEMIDDKTFLAFRNVNNAYLIEGNELNAYLAAAYSSIVMEKAVFEKLTKES
ncbi:50S ribosomal subunit (LSU) protein L4 [Sulfurovum sp. enrichment culture clone C5]|uniref:Large ribosomal subunit protein uL4 n=1 Tax=Sulfurovum sp. enrichment culture clone C5 TaxID=497650 RepID=A0A0S4XQ31_9BACT|nr:50S ribosomal subunit (LSU) protein L4 [Sulfurovum sp. enrichment culture clone C5]